MANNPLIEWMVKREDLRKRKEARAKQWTDDLILHKYRFTNVRRRDDRVSRICAVFVVAFTRPSYDNPTPGGVGATAFPEIPNLAISSASTWQ